MAWEIKPTGAAAARLVEPLRRSIQDVAATADRDTLAVLRNPDFTTLVRERTAFGWILSVVILAVYLSFIFLVAFAPDLMATKLGGGEISLGILLGLCVIVFAVLITGLYVWRANGRFDDLTRDLRRTEGR